MAGMYEPTMLYVGEKGAIHHHHHRAAWDAAAPPGGWRGPHVTLSTHTNDGLL